jgi:hypothetical protein
MRVVGRRIRGCKKPESLPTGTNSSRKGQLVALRAGVAPKLAAVSVKREQDALPLHAAAATARLVLAVHWVVKSGQVPPLTPKEANWMVMVAPAAHRGRGAGGGMGVCRGGGH